MAAITLKAASGRFVGGGYFKDVRTIECQRRSGVVLCGYRERSYEIRSGIVGAWDSAANILSIPAYTAIIDKSSGLLRGVLHRQTGARAEHNLMT